MRGRRPFHEAWLWITFLLLVVGFAFGLAGLLILAGLLTVVLALAWIWNRAALRGVTYERWARYRRAFPGEEVEGHVAVRNDKALPLVWLRTSDRWPHAVGPREEGLLAPSHRPEFGFLHLILAMRGYASTIRDNPLVFRRRGVYRLGPVEATAGDPFGLFVSQEEDLAERTKLTVFPKVAPVSDLGLNPDDPFGEKAARRRLFEDISRPMGVREYRPEDGFRRIHWPATAKVGRLQTRVFQSVRGLDLVVCLNASTFEHHWEGTDPEMVELLIRTAASIVMQAFEDGFRVGLISNGSIAHSGQAFRIPPGRSKGHLPHLLEALAGLTPVVTSPFERYLMAQAPGLEYGSILVVITAITPPVLMEALVQLRSRNRRTALISLSDEPPPFIEGVDTHHIPRGAQVARA